MALALERLPLACLPPTIREQCDVFRCEGEKAVTEVLAQHDTWAMACVDVGDGTRVDIARSVRERCAAVGLLLVVDEGASPMNYIRPGIMPSGLIQRPTDEATARKAMHDFVRYCLKDSEEDIFAIETKETVVRLSYDEILCFEARRKRVCARTRREEYPFYDTLERIAGMLPDFFMRCHRSYIANGHHVYRLLLSSGELELDDGSSIPVARSYRSKVKEALS
jgi:hypothetical protein